MDEDNQEKGEKKPYEVHAETLGLHDWELAGIKHLKRWPDGFEVTLPELKKARNELLKLPIGGE